MGSIISPQPSMQSSTTPYGNRITKNWQILQKTINSQILQSKKTQLIVQRYWCQIQSSEQFESLNKLYQWRNTNPNSQCMVNVLSVGKDEGSGVMQCGSWCFQEAVSTRVYVVTERLLKLGEMAKLQRLNMEMEHPQHKKLYTTQQQNSNTSLNQHEYQTLAPFLDMKFTPSLALRLIKDWLRGIQVLCYKFGYFKLTSRHLGITLYQRGVVWISDNYAINYLRQNQKIIVSTAQQKFRFEKQTIDKILSFIGAVSEWKEIVETLKKCSKFQEVSIAIERWMFNGDAKNEERKMEQLKTNRNNISLFVEHGSFLSQRDNHINNNSGFFMFDHQNAFKKLHSQQQILLNQRFQTIDSQRRQFTSSDKSLKKSIKRSSTGDKLLSKNLSNQSQGLFILNSGHKCCGKQTLPTNQLGHSSSMQSVNACGNMKNNCEGVNFNNNKNESKTIMLVKSQNDTKIHTIIDTSVLNGSPKLTPQPKRIYFPQQNVKHSFSSEPYMFRSQTYHHDSNFHNISQPGYPLPHNPRRNTKISPHRNYSLDQQNIIGPYRTDRVYSYLKKEKITLVDSMVMVREQSEDIDDDILNEKNGNYVLEESVIIRGRDEDNVLAELYD